MDVFTKLENVFEKETVLKGLRQRSLKGSDIMASRAITRNTLQGLPLSSLLATGNNRTIVIPSFAPLRTAYAVQKESTKTDVVGLTTDLQVAVRNQKHLPYGVTAIAMEHGIEDPVAAILDGLRGNRGYEVENTLIAILRGVFGSSDFSALNVNNFSETGASPSADKLIDGDMFDDATAVLGQGRSALKGGVIYAPSHIFAQLRKQDKTQFTQESKNDFMLEFYKGFQCVENDDLVRDGTTSGKVYEMFVLGPSTVALAEKDQVVNELGTASIQLKKDSDLNEIVVHDRIDYCIHPNGAKWVGTPTATTPTLAELATTTNWAKGVSDVKTAGMIRIRTNG